MCAGLKSAQLDLDQNAVRGRLEIRFADLLAVQSDQLGNGVRFGRGAGGRGQPRRQKEYGEHAHDVLHRTPKV